MTGKRLVVCLALAVLAAFVAGSASAQGQAESLAWQLGALGLEDVAITASETGVLVECTRSVASVGGFDSELTLLASISVMAGDAYGNGNVVWRHYFDDGEVLEMSGSSEDAAAFLAGELEAEEYTERIDFRLLTRGPELTPGDCLVDEGQDCLNTACCACRENETCRPDDRNADPRGCVTLEPPANAVLLNGSYVCAEGYVWGAGEDCEPEPKCAEDELALDGQCVSFGGAAEDLFGYALRYGDGFGDPDSGWPDAAGEVTDKHYSDGAYVVEVLQAGKMTWSLAPTPPVIDFDLVVEGRIVDAADSGRYGLVFGHQDSRNYYAFLVRPGGQFLISKVVGGIAESLLPDAWTESDAILPGAESNTLAVFREGTSIELHINWTLVATLDDGAFRTGSVGVLVSTPDESDPVIAVFDDFALYTPHSVEFLEDFDSGAGGLPDESEGDAHSYYLGGRYVLEVSGNDAMHLVPFGEAENHDFTIDVAARLAEGPETGRYGLAFRMQDEDNFYYLLLDGEGYFRLGKRVAGRWRAIGGQGWGFSEHIDLESDNWLTVVCDGERISAFANGFHLLTVEDDSFAAGRIALLGQTVADSQPITLGFDDLLVMVPLEDGRLPVAAAGVLFSDDFSDPLSGWPEEEHEDWASLYQDEQYMLAVLAGSRGAWVTAGSASYANIRLSADLLLQSEEGGGTAGLLFRMQDADNYYYFQISDFGEYKVGAQVEGSWRSIAGGGWAYSEAIGTAGEPNHLEVICVGSEMSAYVNGERLVTVSDSTFSEGKVGILAQSRSDSGMVVSLFDNFLVTSEGER